MRKVLYVFVGIDLLFVNLIAGYWVYQQYVESKNHEQSQIDIANNLIDEGANDSGCPEGCISLINDLQDREDEVGVISPTIEPTKSSTPVAPVVQKTRSTSYVPIPGSGSTVSTQWTDIAGTDFYLTTSDYPGLIGVYIEANIRLQNGNGEAFIRLYDATNSRGVDGSDLSTQSQTSVFVSGGPLSLWSGNNLYRIQAKSLTADTTHFESGRLKIITEN